MALTLQTKQPAESRLYDLDFGGLMRTGETISAVSSVTSTPSGLTVGATSISGQTVQVRLSSGTTATEYLITCRVTTSVSDTLELEGRLWVEDVASLSTAEQAALDKLVMMVQANVCPELDYSTSTSELRLILSKHQRASIWTLSTAYQLGAVVIPTAANQNGHRYRLLNYTTTGTDQKSGATEPSWSTTRDSQITDNHVIWVEDGYDYAGTLWDLVGAAREGWLLKAAKSVQATDVSDNQGVSGRWSQIYDHCLKQADRFQPVYVL